MISPMLYRLLRFEEAKALLRKMIPVTSRLLGEGHRLPLKMKGCYAEAIYRDPAATLEDLREAVTRFEELAPIARRVLGGEHPLTKSFGNSLRNSRAALAARVKS